MDSFGFECFHLNNLDQLYVNCLNEQLQYHYNQRMFAWEMVSEGGLPKKSVEIEYNIIVYRFLTQCNTDGLQ